MKQSRCASGHNNNSAPIHSDPWATGGDLNTLFPNGVVGSKLFTIHFIQEIDKFKKPCIVPKRAASATLQASAFINRSEVSAKIFTPILFDNHGDIVMPSGGLHQTHNAKQKLLADTELKNTNIDKYVGDFGDFDCVQKLFPVEDVPVDLNKGKFVGPHRESGNPYKFIDESCCDYDEPFNQDSLLYLTIKILYNQIRLERKESFSTGLRLPMFSKEHTGFRMRASAPLRNYESKTPPEYTFSNIKLRPSGN